MIKIYFFVVLFILYSCRSNQEVDLGNTVNFETANREMRELIYPFLKPNTVDFFAIGAMDLENNPDLNNCNRKYHFDRKEFDTCKLIVLSLILLEEDDRTYPGLIAMDTFHRVCRLRKIYFLYNNSLEGEVNFCSVFNFSKKD